MRTFLIGNVQCGDILIEILRRVFAAFLESDFVAFFDDCVFTTFEHEGIFIASFDQFPQRLVIAIDPDFLYAWSEFFCQRCFRDEFFWNRCNENRAGRDM